MSKPSLSYRMFVFFVIFSQLFSTFAITFRSTAQASPQPSMFEPQSNIEGPDALTNPLSISRVQSSYVAGTSVITLTATNNLYPTLGPDLPDGATVTETAEILTSFVLTDDVNTLRNVSVEETLANGTTLLGFSGAPAQKGDTLTWTLPDIPPQGTAVITMSVETPAAGGSFVELDTGAQAEAELWGTPVSVATRPAVIVPTGIDPSLTTATPDVDIFDADMLWKSAEFTQEPLAMFAYVQSFDYDPYKGSLRGTRGTLWGEAGNSVDQSNILIAMLRAAGVPARYRHGTLSTANAQILIGSMFPSPLGVAGYLPAGTEVSDPAGDPDLIALVQDHWWVEAYLPGSGWTDLDPTFPDAVVGQTFAELASDGTDGIPELPDDLHHTVSLALIVEQYSQFPIGGSFLNQSTPLSITLPTAQVAGKKVILGQFVTDETTAGGAFLSRQITYQPYFGIEENDQGFLGDPFQDLLTNFPLSTQATTAVWIQYEITDLDGNRETFQRAVKDLIGADVRLNGGTPDLAFDSSAPPFLTPDERYINWVLPNDVPEWAYLRSAASLLPTILDLGQESDAILDVAQDVNDEFTAEHVKTLVKAVGRFSSASTQGLAISGLQFARQSDMILDTIESGLRTRMFYTAPRLFAVGTSLQYSQTLQATVDLRTTRATVVVAPGQSSQAAHTAQWLKGLIESELEGAVLEQVYDTQAVTTANVFAEMAKADIAPVLIRPDEMYLLDVYPFSAQGRAYMQEALLEGKSVLAPSQAVLLNGEATLAWWEIDPETGETISVGENGLHTAAINWVVVRMLVEEIVIGILEILLNSLLGSLSGGWLGTNPGGSAIIQLAELLIPIGENLSDLFFSLADAIAPTRARIPETHSEWAFLPAHLCPVDNCGVEQFFLDGLTSSPIPLPEMLFTYGDVATQDFAAAVMPVTGSGGGNPAFTLTTSPALSTIAPNQSANFQASINSNFDDDFTVVLYAPDGWDVSLDDAGNAIVLPAPGAPAGNYTLQVVAQSNTTPDSFDTATHTVTVTALDTVIVSLDAEPNITVPMGNALLNDVSNQTNDGETEIEGAAYTVVIANPGQTEHTYDVTVSGPPVGWVWLNGEHSASSSVTLPAGTTARLGLYILPPDDSLPAPGTNFNVQVSATSDNLSDNDSGTFTMPEQPFNFISSQHTNIYVGSESSVDFSIQMSNVGNGDGNFPISTSLPPLTATVSGLPGSLSLDEGESEVINGTLNTTDIPLGTRFPLILDSPAPDSYTQYALAEVQIVSDLTEEVFQARDEAATTCTLGEPGLSDALESLALAMVHLEESCLNGNCNLSRRDQTASAAYNVALYAGVVAPNLAGVDAVISAADDLTSHDDETDILNDLATLSAAVVTLNAEVCAWSEHKPALQWTPGYGAALVGDTSTYMLELTNEGTLATTYDLTVILPSGTENLNPTLNPGESDSYEFPINSATLGLFDLEATATVAGQNDILASQSAKLNVIEQFMQVTFVNPMPDFVEPGVSSTTISMDVANIANIVQPVTARTTILAPSGVVSYTAEAPVTIMIGSPRSYELQTVNTSDWAEGVYTVTVELLDSADNLVPEGSGYGYLGVGQALGISHAVEPVIVAPGTIEVTTVITTEMLVTPLVTETFALAQETENRKAKVSNLEELSITNETLPLVAAKSEQPSNLNSPFSTYAITRTEDTTPTITYAGDWTSVSNIFASHTNNGSYTWSNTPGDSATFEFSGTWVHVGFVTNRNGGEAEILIDGISQGTVDLYSPGGNCFSSECLAEFVYDGLSDTTHTLELVVAGTAHPNAIGTEVRLDYIDTWDGTTYPNGTFEQDDPRLWRRADAWNQIVEPAASGGSYMNDGAVSNNNSVWFPFTGDSASFVGLADNNTHRVTVWVDGVWQGDVLLYNGTPISRTISFSGFGPGPHVMRVGAFRGEPNVDAFITPAIGPDYDPPTYTGLVRYEEDHPDIRYNGYEPNKRPLSWSAGDAPQASEFSYMQSSTLSDTVSLTFTGSWLNIGLRTRNQGGLAEVFVDGVSYGTINSYSPSEDVTSYQYELITGTHTLTMTVLAESDPSNAFNQLYLDYIEIWDATPVTDNFQNALRAEESGRVHLSSAVGDGTHPNALQGDYVHSGLPNSAANAWYSFVGDSFTFYGLTESNGGSAEVYVDGQLVETVSFDYPFSVQPYAFHYTGFDHGAHVVRVHNVSNMRVDGFAANPAELIPYQPIAEWWDDAPAGNGAPAFGTAGIGAGMAAGDINNDGIVEIVVTADNNGDFGAMFVYRGDGQDTGDGDPILWKHDFGMGEYRTWVGSPALADLDGQPGAEIVVAAGDELFAFYADGTTYWSTDTVAPIAETLASPAIGNLDLDPEPEIVINTGDFLEIREHDGTLVWSTVYPGWVNPPVLADLNNDGLLDIVMTGWDDTVVVYEYNFGSPQILWTETLNSSMAGTFGAPAVADIDRMQPGGDPSPEVAISHNGALTVLNGEDGSLVWTTPLDPGNPGGVSIADLDGDGEIEIVTGMLYEFEPDRFGMLYALNADGSVLWDVIAEDSTSANNASTLDLDDDGVYEVAWNGKEQGFTIFNGLDGSVIFNDPAVFSLTGTDYPIIVDTDNDDQAEVIVPALGGIRVFGYSTAWGEARPLWNEHSYHITNVNDDLTIPFSEPNSWEVHNTYRTQWPARFVLPTFAVSLTHTVGITDVMVLMDSFNVPPNVENDPLYGWDYSVTWEKTVVTRTFDTQLDNLQPGETRLVAQGTTADYTVPGGQNQLKLPPLYVSVPHIIALDPPTQTVGAGASATFAVVLSNPAQVASQYTLSAGGLPSGWASLPETVNVPAESTATVTLTVIVPTDAEVASLPFVVSVSTDLGGSDQVGGVLHVLGPAVGVAISPANQSVPTGETADFNLSISNLEDTAHTYALSTDGLAPVELPAEITVAANSTEAIEISVQAVGEGANPFTVIATEVNGGASGQDTASVTGDGFQQVNVAILPGTAPSGAGIPTPFDVTVTNMGTAPETYDLSVAVPADWETALTLLGNPVNSVLVAPSTAGITLQLLLTPPTNATPGDYDFTVTAQSQSTHLSTPASLLTSDSADGTVQVGNLGVDVAITSASSRLPSSGSETWDVQITNTGEEADSYDLVAFGPLAAFSQLSQDAVTLNPGASQTVQMTISGVDFALPQDYMVGLHAQSQTQSYIEDEDSAMLTVTTFTGVEVEWLPAAQTVEGTTEAAFTLIVTNTGNINTTFEFAVSSSPNLNVQLPANSLPIPPQTTAFLPVNVNAPGNGTYTLTGMAESGAVQESDTATLTVEGAIPSGMKIYLPLMMTADESTIFFPLISR